MSAQFIADLARLGDLMIEGSDLVQSLLRQIPGEPGPSGKSHSKSLAEAKRTNKTLQDHRDHLIEIGEDANTTSEQLLDELKEAQAQLDELNAAHRESPSNNDESSE